MSVYTPVDHSDLVRLSQLYDLGVVQRLEGIEAGVQNTNYFLYSQKGDFVLTIFETIDHRQVEQTMRFMHFLSLHGIPSSDPLGSCHGNYVETLREKPVAIVRRVSGHSIKSADEEQLQSLAATLAKWHLLVQQYDERWDTRFDTAWRRDTAGKVWPYLDKSQQDMLRRAMQGADSIDVSELAHGVIHADLFRDNALFVGKSLSGIIDLYDIYYGPLIYDIAVLINDWCRGRDELPDLERVRFFIHCYQKYRLLSAAEITVFPLMLKNAALRFWLSRLFSEVFPLHGELALRKNASEFEHLLRFWEDVNENPIICGD